MDGYEQLCLAEESLLPIDTEMQEHDSEIPLHDLDATKVLHSRSPSDTSSTELTLNSPPMLITSRARRSHSFKCKCCDHCCKQPNFLCLSGMACFVCLAVTIVILVVTLRQDSFTYGRWDRQGQPVFGEEYALASEHETCSQIGVQLLQAGGSAVDAACGALLCVGVLNAFSSGIGGGGFMLVYEQGKAQVLDFREAAGRLAHRDMFVGQPPSKSRIGGLAVAIPGELKGMEEAHRRYGRLSWRQLFEPSIDLARNGFKVGKLLAKRLETAKDWILEDEAFRAIYAPQGILVKENQMIKREALARTLETIAEQGAIAFYKGPLADSTLRTIQKSGGQLTAQDFESYQVRVSDALTGYYHGKKIFTSGPPTSGSVLLQIMNVMEDYNLAATDWTPLNAHRLIESFKFGYASRTVLGDADFLNITDFVKDSITKDKASRIRANLTDDRTHNVSYYGADFDIPQDFGTTHVSVIDQRATGMAVSVTSTINLLFGSRLLDPWTGVILNNEMDDFSTPNTTNAFGLPASPHNFIEPGKRPLSSSTPVIIEHNGKIELVAGASGGSFIITSTLQALLRTLDWGEDIWKAIAAPRLHHQLMPNVVGFEKHSTASIIKGLEARGHQVEDLDVSIAAVQMVQCLADGRVAAASDPRKYGVAAAA